LFDETGGAFDPAKGSGFDRLALHAADFTVERLPADDGAEDGGPAGKAVQVDLGAIGKGYAVDRMAAVLEEWDVRQALLDGGRSSVLALDPPVGLAGWSLTLSRPADGVVLERIDARDLALGASGIEKTDHIWNPRTLSPVRERQAAWVAGPRTVLADVCVRAGVEGAPAAVADALSTAFMICTTDEIEMYCGTHPGLEAWILQGEFFHFSTDRPAAPGGSAHEPEM
jgi:thiamine biosynthesis lipoprotein